MISVSVLVLVFVSRWLWFIVMLLFLCRIIILCVFVVDLVMIVVEMFWKILVSVGIGFLGSIGVLV